MSPGDIFFIYLIKVVKYKVARFVNVEKLEEVKREKVTYENDIENMVNEKDKNSSHFNIGKIKKGAQDQRYSRDHGDCQGGRI